MKSFLSNLSVFFVSLLLVSCATTDNPSPAEPLSATGTPSPLNTRANPWTNVNPQIQGQYQAGRLGAAP